MKERLVCEYKRIGLIQAEGGYAIVQLGRDRRPIPGVVSPVAFNNWRELVGFMTEIALSREFLDARGDVLPAKLRNFRMWTSSVDVKLNADQHDAWQDLVEEFFPDAEEDSGVLFVAPQVGELKLLEDETYRFYFSSPRGVSWTAEQLVQMACFVLSDFRTELYAFDQYSPFLPSSAMTGGQKIPVTRAELEAADRRKFSASAVNQVPEAINTARDEPAIADPVPVARETTVTVEAVTEEVSRPNDWQATVRREFALFLDKSEL